MPVNDDIHAKLSAGFYGCIDLCQKLLAACRICHAVSIVILGIHCNTKTINAPFVPQISQSFLINKRLSNIPVDAMTGYSAKLYRFAFFIHQLSAFDT